MISTTTLLLCPVPLESEVKIYELPYVLFVILCIGDTIMNDMKII